MPLGAARRPAAAAAAVALLCGCTAAGGDEGGEIETYEQVTGGETWSLLGSAPVGAIERTEIATTAAQYQLLWADSGLPDDPPSVDLDASVVVWFGATFSGGCDIVLDDVAVTDEVLHGEYGPANSIDNCTDDARPHAFVVAIERSSLPEAPFAVQVEATTNELSADRTEVGTDLRAAGATADDDQLGFDPALISAVDGPVRTAPDLALDRPTVMRMPIDDRVWGRRIGPICGTTWTTPDLDRDQGLPAEWASDRSLDGDTFLVVVLATLSADGATLTAERDGATLTYLPEEKVSCG